MIWKKLIGRKNQNNAKKLDRPKRRSDNNFRIQDSESGIMNQEYSRLKYLLLALILFWRDIFGAGAGTPIISKLKSQILNLKEVKEYVEKAKRKQNWAV